MSKQLTNTSAKQTKQEKRRERREEQRRLEEARLRAVRNWRLAIATVIAVVIIAGSSFALYTLANSRTTGSSAMPATTNTNSNTSNTSDNAAYPPVDNIACNANEQLAYHIHVHLSLYMNGAPVQVPASIGIASDSSCYYWLHVHRTDGIIHIEAPTQKIYTLGNFFRLWGQRFPQLGYPAELDNMSDWQVFVNGKPYTGDFRAIPLTAHTLITMGYKSPGITPDTTYNWGDQ